MFKKLRALLAIRRALKDEERLVKEKGLEAVDASVQKAQEWIATKTYKKAADAATGTAVSTIGTGGVVYALIRLLRAFFPDFLPWSADMDMEIAAALTAAGAPLLSFIRKWRSDKAAHTQG